MTPSGLEENVADRLRLRRSGPVPGAAEVLAVVLDHAFTKRELGFERELCVGKTVRPTPQVSAILEPDEDALTQRMRAAAKGYCGYCIEKHVGLRVFVVCMTRSVLRASEGMAPLQHRTPQGGAHGDSYAGTTRPLTRRLEEHLSAGIGVPRFCMSSWALGYNCG
jgi:hypothetical protein